MTAESGAEQTKSPATLPTGTVTFLFSDIEGSSQKWERHRDAMKAVVARQEELMRTAISGHDGYVFKTLGDAFCAAFPTAPQAVSAAIEAQRSLAKEDFSSVGGLHVRIGLHTGYAEERNADYFGPAVNRVARIMSVGHGGQVLLSEVTRELAHGDLATGASFVDLGLHRLRDLTEPEHVWQLTIEDTVAAFPPLRSLDAMPNNLPIQRTTFVGREHDVTEVKELVGRHHLLTLVGSGGVGNTRLALQVGAELLDQYPDGVWFVDFAPITDPELVSSVIAKVLGMSQQEGHRVDESIPPWLKRKKLLIILDNCEHVLDTVAMLASMILGTAPDVRILTTSRQALDVRGERVSRLESLDVPHKIADLTPAAAMEFGAVALFIDRASMVDKSLVLTDDTAPIVADICRRLDGIPLAIELAAARVKVLSIANLAQRLNERFKILTSGSRDVLPRQKTLGALIDWSYDLLSAQEQLLFKRLGMFASGFGLDAATTVCGGEGLDEIEILDLLTSLTDKSLVVADTGWEQERYHLLESTRAYALEKLTAAGERESLARRHAEYFRDQAQAADERYGTASSFAWLAAVELELDNYRAALEWALTQGNDAVLGGAIAGAIDQVWFRGGLGVEGRYWTGLAIERMSETEQPRLVARLWVALATTLSGKLGYEAAERAARLYASSGDRRGVGRATRLRSFLLSQMGRFDEASEANSQALATLSTCGDKWGIANCLARQASIEWHRGDIGAGRERFAQALAAYKALGDEFGTALVLSNSAELEFADGHPSEALRLVSEVLEIQLRVKDAQGVSNSQINSAAYRIALGDLKGARESSREALRWSRQCQDKFLGTIALQHLAVLSGLGGDTTRPARLLGYVDAQYRELEMEREPTEKWGYNKLNAALREKLSENEVAKLAAEGAAWSEDQAVEEALKV